MVEKINHKSCIAYYVRGLIYKVVLVHTVTTCTSDHCHVFYKAVVHVLVHK